MAIAIVEELWTRIRAAIDDKIVAATTASESAVAAKTAAEAAAIEVQGTVANAATVAAANVAAELQELTGRAETAATTATTAVAAEVEKLKGAAPEAFDTLGEIAAELAANETERSALTNSIAAKADKVHDHTIEQVTGLQGELDGKAPVDHNHHGDYYTKGQADGQYVRTSGNTTITGDLNMDGGSVSYIRPDTTGGWARGFWWKDLDYTSIAGIGVFGDASVVNYLFIGHGDEPWSGSVFRAYQDRISITNLEVTGAVTGIEADDVGAAPVTHTHTSANITDARTWTGRSTDSNAVVMTDAGGWFYVGSNPTHASHPANKAYVDQEVGKKAAAGHTHTAANISDATTVGRSVLTAADSAAARTAIGAGTSSLTLGTSAGSAARGNHTHSEYATTSDMQNRTPEIRIVSSPEMATSPGVLYVVTEG